LPAGYHYQIGDNKRFFPVNISNGQSHILHLRNFHPLDDWYGLSQVEAAAYSIDQHNQAAIWNQALLQNGARPSGAMVVKASHDGGSGVLSDEQFMRIKEQLDEKYCGSINAGRPLPLEGGLEWQEMSMSPKDMDFIEAKNSAARDIALAFGVPPQLLGIPGDNTYSNMQEARLALWEETILPLLDYTTDALNNWLVPMFGEKLLLAYDKDEISGLSARRESIWQRIENVSFMTINEKREAIGFAPLDGCDVLDKNGPKL
jgi:HK97 family phage portal protein